MFNKRYVILTILSAGLMFGSLAFADPKGELCEFQLTTSDVGIANVKIDHNTRGLPKLIHGETVLEVEIVAARPDTLYTVWIDFRNRASLLLADDYKGLLLKGALPRGVAPAFATTAGVTAGMGIDPNGIITDDQGEVEFKAILDYNLLKRGDSPVVGDELAMQGLNRVGGYWLRRYPKTKPKTIPDVAASLQKTDPDTGLPVVERATAQGITIVRHADFITHGHTPGIGGVDHFSGFKGDFPDDCLED